MATGSDPLGAASTWITDLVAGSASLAIAVIAVAAIGFQLMSGRLVMMTAARTLLGVFILLGAGSIAAALIRVAEVDDTAVASQPAIDLARQPSREEQRAPQQPSDPYAGASVPTR